MTERGTVLGGRYELDQVIGRGGMAEVWRARDTRLQRDVAIKRLRIDLASDPTFQARFRREAQASAGLNHPNIVAVYDTGEEKDTNSGVMVPYIVMELIEGVTLREVLRGGRKIVPEKALEFTAGVLDALAYSHRAGIIHRDIKPANVMFTPPGTVKVMDFGIARAVADTSATMTQTAAVIGTAQYLSPEQARGLKVDNRSDIYAVGCLLYELLVSEPPFKGDSPVSVVFQHVREIPIRPSERDPEITPEMDAIVMKALAKDPKDRYQDAQEMREDIQRVLNNQPIATQVPPFAEAPTQVIAPDPITTTARRAALPAAVGALGGTASGQPSSSGTPVEAEDEAEGEPKPRRGTKILIGVLAGVVVIGLIIFLFLFFDREPIPAPPASPSPTITQESPKPSPSESPTIEKVAVPHVAGMDEAAGLNKMRDANLKPIAQRVEGTEENNGKIDRSDPPEGTQVPVGTTVTVYVFQYEAPEMINVPGNLVNMSEADARKALVAAGFPNESISTTNADASLEKPGTEKGIVLAVSHSGAVKPGTAITLTVSTGNVPEPKVPVPELLGSSELAAKRALEAVELKLEAEDVETDEAPAGTVFKQDPPAGTEVDRGTAVRVRIAVAPKPPSSESPTDGQTSAGRR